MARRRATRGSEADRYTAVLSGAVVVLLFVLVLVVRWRGRVSNIDDYLYARETWSLLHGLSAGPHGIVHAWRAFGTSAPLLPTIALPVAAFNTSPNVLVIVQLVPLLVLLVSVRFLLVALGVPHRAAWLGAVFTTCAAPVLGYAGMYHFAVAATACAALAVAAYANSDRFLRRGQAVLLGAAMGGLAISRVMAPVYVVAVAVPIGIDALVERDRRSRRVANAAVAVLIAAIVAAPWWLAVGHQALHYLTSAGYGASPLAGHGSRLDVLHRRLTWTASETGWLLAVILAAMVLWAIVCLWRGAPHRRLLGTVLAIGFLGMAMLATSGNSGTAFALPFLVLFACAGEAACLHLGRRVRRVVLAGGAGAVVLGLVALLGPLGAVSISGKQLWQTSIPAVEEAQDALGCPTCRLPDTGAVSRRVLRVIGTSPTLVVRDDPLLNVESLRFYSATNGAIASLQSPRSLHSLNSPSVRHFRYVIAGSSALPFTTAVNPLVAIAALRSAHFHQVFSERFSPVNFVAVWAAPGPAQETS